MSYFSEAREYHEREKYEEAYKLYEQGANAGDEKCFYGIALFFHEGYFVEENKEKAAKIFAEHFDAILKLAENGDAEAMFIVCCCYANGYYVTINEAISYDWLTKSADAGYAIAQQRLAYRYYHGYYFEKDFFKAVEWYKKAADQGNVEAQLQLGYCYEYGEGVEQNFCKALEWYKKSAEQNNSNAQWRVGAMYYFGKGVENNLKLAAQWFEKSAQLGNSVAQWRLGHMYNNAEGGLDNPVKAVELYCASAEKGNSEALWRLGTMYHSGRGVTQDRNKAKELFGLSAQKDNPRGQWRYGTVLREQGDYAEALKWFKASASQDNSKALCLLGDMYRLSYGVERDYKQAVLHYKKAVEKMDPSAYWRLGLMYESGEGGLDKDIEKAEDLYRRAVNEGNVHIDYIAPYLLGNIFLIKNKINESLKLYELGTIDGYAPSINKLGKLYYEGHYVKRDYHRAFVYWSSVPAKEKDGEHHFYLGQCYHNCRGVDYDISDESTKVERLTKAKEHYKKALEYGFSCRLAYEMVKRDLGERSKGGDTRFYAEELLNTTIDKSELLEKVEDNLKNDFGEYWNKLKDNTKQALISGIFYYVMNISCGDEICNKVDFTNVVATLSKALEIELAEFFGKGYIEFLRDIKKLPAYKFDPEYNKFVLYPDRPYERKFVRDENAYIIKREAKVEYCDERNNYGFSLGSLYYLLNVRTMPVSDFSNVDSKMHRNVIDTKKGKSIRVIDPYMQEYVRLLFRKDAFGEGDFDEMATNYLIDLAEDVRFIKDIRNPADHEIIVNRKNAEVLCDALVKTPDYKILCELLDKISPEYIQKSLEAPIKLMDNKSL